LHLFHRPTEFGPGVSAPDDLERRFRHIVGKKLTKTKGFAQFTPSPALPAALNFALLHAPSGKPVPGFPDHALRRFPIILDR
jgi:hypothetical protein